MAIQQNFPEIKPSLNLDFANTKALDPRVTFSRASTATYYDGKSVSKAEENLLIRSQEFDNASWVNFNSTDSANTTTAPDGTTTADTLNEGVSTGVHQITQAFAFLSGVNYTLSVYAKFVDNPYLHLAAVNYSSSNLYASAVFNIQTGTFITSSAAGSGYSVVGTPTISDAGNGWYRCSVVITFGTGSSTGNSAFFVYMGNSGTIGSYGGESYTGTSRSVLLWGAQLEQRSSVTAYTPTTTQAITNYIPVLQTAAANVARFDHNPTTGESLGLLIEEQRTNLLLRSEEFGTSWINLTSSVLSSNAAIAPDGALTAEKFAASSGVGTSSTALYQIVNKSAVATTYTMSVYAKRGERDRVRMTIRDAASGSNALTGIWSLVDGSNVSATAAGTFTSVSVTATSVGNGWYRFTLTGTTSTETSLWALVYPLDSVATTGDGYSGIYIWGAQLEAGAFPTSYIKTEGSQVTRSADAASMTGANFSSWYRADEGTVYAETSGQNTANGRIWGISDGTTSNRIFSFYIGNSIESRVTISGATQCSFAISVVDAETKNKSALAFAFNDIAGSVNSSNITSDVSCNIPVVTLFRIGVDEPGTGNSIGGHVKKIAYYPSRLPNATLQAITS